MLGRMLAAVLCGMLLTAGVWAEEKPTVKEIDLKEVKGLTPKGRFGAPTEITTADDATKLFGEEFGAKLKKEVNFDNQKLVYFAWQGSGQDRVSFEAGKGDKPEVKFSYAPGRTRDLRPHARLFVLPKNATIKIGN